MNNKVALGLVAALILIGIAFAYFYAAPSASAPLTATSTTPAATTTGAGAGAPAVTAATTSTTAANPSAPVVKKTNRVVTLDSGSLASHTSRPTLTGTANVSGVAIVIDNPEGVGIAGSWEIPVVNGKWSYTAPQALKPGTYTVHLLGADAEVTAKLVVTAQ